MAVNLDALDTKRLFADMFSAGAGAFGEGWSTARDFAKVEFKTLARRIKEIAKQVGGGLDPAIAKLQFKAQVNTAVQVLAGVTTLTLLAVEAAINAVLDVIKAAVDTAIGFPLIG